MRYCVGIDHITSMDLIYEYTDKMTGKKTVWTFADVLQKMKFTAIRNFDSLYMYV